MGKEDVEMREGSGPNQPMTVAHFKSDAAKREKGRVLRQAGFTRHNSVPAIDFAYEPLFKFQNGIFILALGKWKTLQCALRSHLAPPDRQAVFHCHAEPILSAGRGRAFQNNARVGGKGKQEVRIVLNQGNELVQTLENGRSRKLIDRIPTVRGGFILYGRVASCHSPDCFPWCVKTRCTSSCNMARVSLQALNPKALSSA